MKMWPVEMTPLWKSAKSADSHRGLEKPSALPHFHKALLESIQLWSRGSTLYRPEIGPKDGEYPKSQNTAAFLDPSRIQEGLNPGYPSQFQQLSSSVPGETIGCRMTDLHWHIVQRILIVSIFKRIKAFLRFGEVRGGTRGR
jgi:hypothetical protein